MDFVYQVIRAFLPRVYSGGGGDVVYEEACHGRREALR